MVVKFNEADFPTNDQIIWRYLSFSKFVSLLAGRQLHFTRTDKFLDTFESSIPSADLQSSRDYFASLLDETIVDVGGISKFEKSSIREYIGHFLNLRDSETKLIIESDLPRYMLQISNRFQFVNCWHQNDGESAGMWQLYLNSNEGLAIQTTVGSLIDCLELCKYPVYLGPVVYLDYSTDSWGSYHPLKPIFHKRKSFAHEKELRAVIINPPDIDPKNTSGILLDFPLKSLIKKLFVSPKVEPWFMETVKHVSSKYGLDIEPTQSQLYDQPQY